MKPKGLSIDTIYKILVIVLFLLVLGYLIGASIYKNNTYGILKEKFKELKGKISPSANKLEGKPTSKSVNPNVRHMIADRLLLDDFKVEDKHIEKANKYHDTFSKYHDERLGSLGKAYSELGKPKTVVTMFYCKKFFVFFENWVLGCEKNKIGDVRKFTITFSLDKESYQKTLDMGFKTILISPEKYEQAGDSQQFGDGKFAGTMFYKNAFIYDFLTILPLGNSILFQDSDLIWFRNPIPYLEKQPEDILIMYDGPNYHFNGLYANTGFIFLRNNNNTRSFMETTMYNTAYIFAIGGHQKAFNRILEHYYHHNILSTKVLDELDFANGHLLDNTSGKLSNKLKSNWKSNAYVMHYSWTGNIQDKFKKLERLGLKYVSR